MLPVLCYTCGKCLGHLYFLKNFTNDLYTEHGITRNCCKKVLNYSIDITDNPCALVNPNFDEIQMKDKLEEVKILFPR